MGWECLLVNNNDCPLESLHSACQYGIMGRFPNWWELGKLNGSSILLLLLFSRLPLQMVMGEASPGGLGRDGQEDKNSNCFSGSLP